MSSFLFELIHVDLWTSPVLSFSGFKFYLVLLDDFSHFTWTFLLKHKSDVSDVIISFCSLIQNQLKVFNVTMVANSRTPLLLPSLVVRHHFAFLLSLYRLIKWSRQTSHLHPHEQNSLTSLPC